MFAMRLSLVNQTIKGHGIYRRKYFLQMPRPYVVNYVLILFIIIGVGWGFQADGTEIATKLEEVMNWLGWSALIGWFVGILQWYLVAGRMTYYLNEMQIRQSMEEDGLPDDVVDKRIERLRRAGMLRPKKHG